MNISTLQSYLTHHITFFTWRDGLEIVFFWVLFYYLALWLTKDTEKKLLLYFYGYCMLALTTHLLQLTTLTSCLFIFSPAVIMIFMFMHQETLQRNMITLKNITASPSEVATDWLSCLMRHTLKALNNNQELIFLIEHTDTLHRYVNPTYILNAPINEGLLALLLDHVHNPHQMSWIKSDGTIQGINVSWKASWHPAAYHDQLAWIDDAIAYTTKTDALIMHVDPKHHQCAIAYDGAIHSKLTVEQAGKLLRKQINYRPTVTKKGYTHDSTSKKNNLAQRVP